MDKIIHWIIEGYKCIFKRVAAAIPPLPPAVTIKVTLKEDPMGSPADTLVAKFPDRISQLKGPVFDYLKRKAVGFPFSSNPQDLYMAVFYPVARRWSPDMEFPADVRKANPGINKVSDYVRYVNAAKGPSLTSAEETALKEVAGDLGVTRDSLYKLIALESAWDPQARNSRSGARGLIQFMPFVAKEMGFKALVATEIGLILFIVGAGLFLAKHYKIF